MMTNKWTLGLAAAGLVAAPVPMLAEEKANAVWTALSSTTIEGYVNTSAQWDFGSGNGVFPNYAFNRGKQDGFNFNVAKIAIHKPLDESAWASGYRVELIAGPDAAALATSSQQLSGGSANDFAIKQAYVAMRLPWGNGIDARLGVFDTIIGYETFDAGSNPNYTRSYGYTMEPTTHTGLLLSYQICPHFSMSGGVANTAGPIIGDRAFPAEAESYKTYMGSFAITAPEDWGGFAGSTLYFGVVNGFSRNAGVPQTSLYGGVTLNTPIEGFKVGASYDYAGTSEDVAGNTHYANAAALYASIQLGEKTSFHARGEYAWTDTAIFDSSGSYGVPDVNNGSAYRVLAATATLQYDLWKNVISRLEFRWDHLAGDSSSVEYGGTPAPSSPGGALVEGTRRNNYMLVANFIYKF
jgi:hypothetical protein